MARHLTLPTVGLLAPGPLPWQARLPFFYGWVIVGVAVLMGLMFASLNWVALGVFAGPMQDELGWSRTALFSALTVRTYLAASLSPLFGRYFDSRNGARIISTVSGLLTAGNMFMLSTVQTESQFMLQFGIIGGIVTAGQGGQVAAIVPKWFVRQRGRSMAWATMGSASAAFLLPPLLAWLIATLGWRGAWVAMGVLVFLLAGVPALLIRRQPEDIGLRPDGVPEPPPGRVRPPDEHSFTLRQAFRTRTAWLILAGTSLGGLANGGLPGNMAPMLQDQGLGRDAAVLGLTLYGIGSMGGRFVWSFPADRFHIRWVLMAIAAQGFITTPLLPLLSGPWALLYPVLVGIGIGGYVGFNQLIWAQYFGRGHLGSITGVARPAFSLVSGTAPIILSLSSDLTHAYAPALWFIAACYGLAALAYLLAAPPKAPVVEAAPAVAVAA